MADSEIMPVTLMIPFRCDGLTVIGGRQFLFHFCRIGFIRTLQHPLIL